MRRAERQPGTRPPRQMWPPSSLPWPHHRPQRRRQKIVRLTPFRPRTPLAAARLRLQAYRTTVKGAAPRSRARRMAGLLGLFGRDIGNHPSLLTCGRCALLPSAYSLPFPHIVTEAMAVAVPDGCMHSKRVPLPTHLHASGTSRSKHCNLPLPQVLQPYQACWWHFCYCTAAGSLIL